MGAFVKGDVVVFPFPYSDLSGAKRRPALVICDLPGDDIIACQITSVFKSDPFAIVLVNADFKTGSLRTVSNIRPNKIFTASKKLIQYTAGHILETKTAQVIEAITSLINK